MKKITAAFLAVTASTLAGCGDDPLTIEEKQAQLYAAFAEIDALPKYTQDRFQEFSDPDGDCAVAYKDRERGIQMELKYVPSIMADFMAKYFIQYPLPQMVRVDCDDLDRAFDKIKATLTTVHDAQSLKSEEHSSLYYKKSMGEYNDSIASGVRDRKILNIETFGLK